MTDTMTVFRPDSAAQRIFEAGLKGINDNDLRALCAALKVTEKWAKHAILNGKKKRAWSDAPKYRVRSNQTRFQWQCEHKDGVYRITDVKQISAL